LFHPVLDLFYYSLCFSWISVKLPEAELRYLMATLSKDHLDPMEVARTIDHTLLLPTATTQQVDEWCAAADRYHFASVCVNPYQVRRAVERLRGSQTKVSTVIGFPLGTHQPEVKLYEAQMAVDQGAVELEVRINTGFLKDRQTDALHTEIAQIVEATRVPIKAILETALLSDEEKRLAGEICIDAGVQFLKTSTGWTSGATVEDVRLLWEISQGKIGIKASGGIRTLEKALLLLQAGASRLGTSYGLDIMQELQHQES
jgi:deoxyribose-phosphate aldolase